MNRQIFHNPQVKIAKYANSNGKHLIGDKVYRKITCVEAKAFPNELKFYIPRQGEQMLKNVYLRIDLPAVSGFSGGSYVRFVNNIAVRLFSKFELWSGGNLILQRFPDEIIYNLLPHIRYEKWQKLKVDIGNEDTAASRNTLAASAQNLVLNMKYVFDIFAKAFPICHIADQTNALELRCTIVDQQGKIVQTDHTTKGTITIGDVFLECTYQNAPEVVMALKKSHAEARAQGKHGWQCYTHEYKRRNHPVAASASINQDIDVRQFQKQNVANITFLIRDTADLSTQYAYDYDNDLQAVTSFQLKDGSDNLFFKESQITDVEYRKYLLDQYKIEGIDKIFDKNIYLLYFGECAKEEFDEEHKVYSGTLDTTKYSDLRLNLVLASTSTGKNVDILCTIPKRLTIKEGKLRIIH